MNIKVTPHSITINKEEIINSGEYDVSKCQFEFSNEYEGLTKQAVFSTCENTYKVPILNDECTIPGEVLTERGSVLLGVYGYETIEGSLAIRYSPTPQYFSVTEGSYREGNDPDLPEPSEWEQVLEQVNTAIDEANNLNIEAEKVDHTTTITITKKDGTTDEVEILDGEQGPPGPPGAVKFIIVQTLPTENIQTDAIYLVPKDDPTTTDLYNEYMYVDNNWELLGQKQIVVDLTDYVKFTDYPTNDGTKSGVIKVNSTDGISVNTSNNRLQATITDYGTYQGKASSFIIGKGTLENVITGKALETSNNKVTSISSASTDTQYPSAKCVYDLVGNLETILTTLDIGTGVGN